MNLQINYLFVNHVSCSTVDRTCCLKDEIDIN